MGENDDEVFYKKQLLASRGMPHRLWTWNKGSRWNVVWNFGKEDEAFFGSFY